MLDFFSVILRALWMVPPVHPATTHNDCVNPSLHLSTMRLLRNIMTTSTSSGLLPLFLITGVLWGQFSTFSPGVPNLRTSEVNHVEGRAADHSPLCCLQNLFGKAQNHHRDNVRNIHVLCSVFRLRLSTTSDYSLPLVVWHTGFICLSVRRAAVCASTLASTWIFDVSNNPECPEISTRRMLLAAISPFPLTQAGLPRRRSHIQELRVSGEGGSPSVLVFLGECVSDRCVQGVQEGV